MGNLREYNREYYRKNRESILASRREIIEEQLKLNPNFFRDHYQKYKSKWKDKKFLSEKLRKWERQRGSKSAT